MAALLRRVACTALLRATTQARSSYVAPAAPQHPGALSAMLIADGAPTKDLSRVLGNVRVRVRALRKQRVETATIALTEQEEKAEGTGLRPRTMYKNDTLKLVFEDQ
ncbi:unnamed protein product [Boreogadus saida]